MSITRLIASLLLGFVGAITLWVAVPFNNFILGNAFLSDDFMPAGAVGLMLVLLLIVNPVLYRLFPRLHLNFHQLAVIFGILLVASITPGQGGFRHILYSIGVTPTHVSENATTAAAYEVLDAPDSLFPEPLALDAQVPASEYFVDELPEGEPIPWANWKGPLLAWSGFFLPYWVMLVALALIVLPYWRDTERQPFPLLQAQQALITGKSKGGLPAALSTPLFWGGFGLVLFLHLLYGLNQYFPDRIPAIKLFFNLGPLFSEEPARYLPNYMRSYQIHFLFLGIAYFMPNRVGFSIWFFQVAYAIYIMLSTAYAPPFDGRVILDQRLGAWIALPLAILWLGRRHWKEVLTSVFRKATNDTELRNKIGGTALLLGMAGMLLWLLWVRVPFVWALTLVLILFLFAIGMTRIVAETGIPLVAPDTQYISNLAKLLPESLRTASGMYFSGVIAVIGGHLNRVCAATMVCHALGLDPKATPRRHVKLAGLFLGVLVASLLIGGAIQLALTYNHAQTLNGERDAMGMGGSQYFSIFAEPLLQGVVDDRVSTRSYNQWGHIAFGGGLSLFLMFMCSISARWPLHPVPLLLVGGWYAHRIWFSVFLGWGIKMLMLNYGGARAYRAGRTLFLGLILGEVTAVIFWALIAAVLAFMGLDYEVIKILPT